MASAVILPINNTYIMENKEHQTEKKEDTVEQQSATTSQQPTEMQVEQAEEIKSIKEGQTTDSIKVLGEIQSIKEVQSTDSLKVLLDEHFKDTESIKEGQSTDSMKVLGEIQSIKEGQSTDSLKVLLDEHFKDTESIKEGQSTDSIKVLDSSPFLEVEASESQETAVVPGRSRSPLSHTPSELQRAYAHTKEGLEKIRCPHRRAKYCVEHKKCPLCRPVSPSECWICTNRSDSGSGTPPEYRELEALLQQGTPPRDTNTQETSTEETNQEENQDQGSDNKKTEESTSTQIDPSVGDCLRSTECLDLTRYVLGTCPSTSSYVTVDYSEDIGDPDPDERTSEVDDLDVLEHETARCNTDESDLSLTRDSCDNNKTVAILSLTTDVEDSENIEPIATDIGEVLTVSHATSEEFSVVIENPQILDEETTTGDNSFDTVPVPELNPQEHKIRMDLNEKLESTLTEVADLRLQLNAAQQAKAALELEVGKKDEMILITEAEALKREQNLKQEIKQLREQLKENTKKNENLNDTDLEEQIKSLKTREGKLLSEISRKNSFEVEAKQLLDEYSATIKNQTVQLEKVHMELETHKVHLENIEAAFSDLHCKYEKVKECLKLKVESEESLLTQLNLQIQLRKQDEERYEALKAHAHSQIDKANRENNNLKMDAEDKLSKQNAIIRRLDIKVQSLEINLQQKTKECEVLASLCDEVTGKKRST